MKKTKKIRPLSFAMFQGVMGAILGLLLGILYSFGGLIIDALVTYGALSAASADTPGLSYGTVLAFGALIGMPAIFAAFGFVLGLFEALIFNGFSRWLGWITIEYEK